MKVHTKDSVYEISEGYLSRVPTEASDPKNAVRMFKPIQEIVTFEMGQPMVVKLKSGKTITTDPILKIEGEA